MTKFRKEDVRSKILHTIKGPKNMEFTTRTLSIQLKIPWHEIWTEIIKLRDEGVVSLDRRKNKWVLNSVDRIQVIALFHRKGRKNERNRIQNSFRVKKDT